MASLQLEDCDKPYGPSEINFLRSVRILSVITGVFQYVFREGTKDRSPEEALLDYFQRKGTNISKFQKPLNSNQKYLIQNYPDGSRFDITLLFKCIQHGCDKIAKQDDIAWKVEGDKCLESFLTELKNWRNELYHELPGYDDQQFFSETNKVRSLLSNVMEHAGSRYGIRKTNTEKMIKDMSDIINKLRDESWMPLDFESYRKLTLFSVKENYIRDEGKKRLYKLYRDWIVICPSTVFSEVKFKVEEIYTRLTLKRAESQGGDIPQKLEDLLVGIDDRVILLEGHAGSGKSTLTKKILSDWIYSHQSSITNLNDYDLLLYTEFRKHNLKSFKDLITTLMPEVAESFVVKDFCRIIRSLNILVILDGLDELNDSSMSLFRDILELKTDRISVMVTSRPERIETYNSLAKTNNIDTKHIVITGIAEERREEFVSKYYKYYKEMEKKDEAREDIKGLLTFLRRTARRLSHLWQLPYNLIMLVLLWVYESETVNSITTATELYWKIYQLYKQKLSDRLLSRKEAQAWDESKKKDKIQKMMLVLGQVALICLGNDKIELSEDDYEDLKKRCRKEGLPAEEMTGAFLKVVKINTGCGYETRYSFPHKSLQDFLAAAHILREAEKKTRRSNKRRFAQCSSASTQDAPAEEVIIVKNILVNSSATSGFDIRKYQNVLVTLIGLFHLRSNHIKDSIKIEVLHLLQEAGINDKYEWLKILDSVKCDATVSSFISQQHNIFHGKINIGDHNVYAFHSLLQAHPFPIVEADDVIIDIDLKEETPVIGKLLEMLNKKKLNVETLQLYHDFRNPGVHSVDAINSVMQRCAVKSYRGPMLPSIQLSASLVELFVSLTTEDDIKQLQIFLHSHTLNRLGVCLSAETASSLMQISPVMIDFCFMVDITRSNISSAAEILKKIKPSEQMYGSLWFPRSSLEPQDQLDLIGKMAEVGILVSSEIHFPSKVRPSSEAQRKQIVEEATKKCLCGVFWGNVFGSDIDDW